MFIIVAKFESTFIVLISSPSSFFINSNKIFCLSISKFKIYLNKVVESKISFCESNIKLYGFSNSVALNLLLTSFEIDINLKL